MCFSQLQYANYSHSKSKTLCLSLWREKQRSVSWGNSWQCFMTNTPLSFFPNPRRQNFTEIKEVGHNLAYSKVWMGKQNWIQPEKKNAVISRTEISSKTHFIKTNFNRKLFQGWLLILSCCCDGTVCREGYFLVGSCVKTEMRIPSWAPLFFELLLNWDRCQLSSTSLFPHNPFPYMFLRHLFNKLQRHP